MSDSITTFFDAWGMSDDAARAAAISTTFASEGTYTDPRSSGTLTGPEAITEYVTAFSANAPGWTAQVTKLDQTGPYARATVTFGGKGPDGSEMKQNGQYFAKLDGDTITEMVGFVGTGELSGAFE
ncbi:MAG: nuclear transport factor 2 family protein [Marinovum sp.]|nr:nuclear transport factor 2 family protein [Marinovum sp.]